MCTDTAIPVVQYIRMSTEHQDLSPDMQKVAIENYAARNRMKVIGTYLDAGRSGLTLQKRPAMKKLLRDVTSPDREFSAVLVYDISRWGRFQDTDASAYYEYHCRLHGVDVRYVQEPFSSTDSALSALMKSMKRAMAAEFSRELAVKTRQGQAAAIAKGFHLGTLPCLGFRKIAVAKADGSERLLELADHKAGHREHVRWVWGPEVEINLVRRIFTLYATTEISVVALARQLQSEGIRAKNGQLLSEWMLYSFLRSESVLGNFLWGRAENKRRHTESDERFTRVVGMAEPIVSRSIFNAVQIKLARRKHVVLSRETLLESLRGALSENPQLRGHQLKTHGCPCRETYIKRFGSLTAAWAAAGAIYPSKGSGINWADIERTAATGALMCKQVQAALQAFGVQCTTFTRADRRGQTLLVNGSHMLRVQVIWKRRRCGSRQWELRKTYKSHFHSALVVRMQDDFRPLDSILLTRDQYFASDKWLHDELAGDWEHYKGIEQLRELLLRLQ